MEPEVCSNRGGAARAAEQTTAPGNGPARDPVPRGTARAIDGRAEDRHVWALAALLVPLVFCAIVGVGVFLMFHRNMGYFKPAPSGRSLPVEPAVAAAPPASTSA